MRCILACALGLSACAHADSIDLFIFENATNTDVSNIDINVEIVDAGGGEIGFVFSNDSSIASFISAIYIESTQFSTASFDDIELGDVDGDVSFSDGANPANPAGSIKHFGGDWGGSLFSADRDNGMGNKWGIHMGESLTVDVELDGVSFDDVVDAAGTPLFRFATHIQGVGPNGVSIWGTNGPETQVVPLPPAAFAGLGLLGAMGALRFARRR